MSTQIIQRSKPSFGEMVGGNLGGGISQGFANAMESKEKKELGKQEFAQQMQLERAKKMFGLEADLALEDAKQKRMHDLLRGIYKNDQQDGESPEGQMGSNQQGSQGFRALPDDIVAELGVINPNLAKIYMDQQKLHQDKNLKERDFQLAGAKPFVEEVESLRSRMPYKESASRLMKNAIMSGQEGMSWDYLAQATGYEPLMSQEGAKLIAGTKEFLLGNIGRGGTRPNMWLEQQIASMAPKLGRSKAANLAVSEAIDNDGKIEAEKIRVYDQIMDEYSKVHGVGAAPADISKRVSKEMKPFIDLQNDKLAYKLREYQEMEMSPESMNSLAKVPPGTPLTLKKANAIYLKSPGDTPDEKEKNSEKIAKKLGYEIYGPEIYRGE